MLKPNTFVKATTATFAACILMACGGESSDSDIVSTNTYTLTPTASEMGPTEGKSIFTLNVKDADGIAVNSVVPMIMPMMTMSEAKGGHQHSTPYTGCSATDIDGNADCTVYFLMPTQMNDIVMGTWDLAFSLPDSDEKATNFTPNVKMKMGDTVKATLKGGMNDEIAGMEMDGMVMPTARAYYIFNNGLTGMGDNRSIELFIAAKESMMSFPALAENTVLNSGTTYELTATSITVQVSTNNSDWIDATTSGKGIWQATELTDLVDNQETTLYVKLKVNGEDKTTDGDIADGANASAQFTLKMATTDMSEMNGAM